MAASLRRAGVPGLATGTSQDVGTWTTMGWVFPAAVSIGQSLILGVAAWAWAAFCAAAIVRAWGGRWGITVTGTTLAFAAAAAAVVGAGAAVLIYHLHSFSILGIHQLEVRQPALHEIWWGLLAIEPLGSAARFLANRRMWAGQAALAGHEYVLRPRLIEIFKLGADAVMDWIGGSR